MPHDAPKPPGYTRFVCVSDTHSRTDPIQMPYGDVLIHAGDFTELGLPSEVKKFNEWLGRCRAAGGLGPPPCPAALPPRSARLGNPPRPPDRVPALALSASPRAVSHPGPRLGRDFPFVGGVARRPLPEALLPSCVLDHWHVQPPVPSTG